MLGHVTTRDRVGSSGKHVDLLSNCYILKDVRKEYTVGDFLEI